MELNTKFNWQNIDGWLENKELCDKIVRDATNGDIIVQLNGNAKNICYLASRVKLSQKAIRIINIHNSNDFREIMIKSGTIDIVTTINADIKSARNFFQNHSLFAVFLKSHDFLTTSNLIQSWASKIKKGGYLIGNNASIPEVKKAVKVLCPKCDQTNEILPAWLIKV